MTRTKKVGRKPYSGSVDLVSCKIVLSGFFLCSQVIRISLIYLGTVTASILIQKDSAGRDTRMAARLQTFQGDYEGRKRMLGAS